MLYLDYRKQRYVNYRRFFTFCGTFSEALPKVISEKEYDLQKDKAILTIGGGDSEDNQQTKNLRQEAIDLRKMLATIPGITQKQIAKHCKKSTRTIQKWKVGDSKTNPPSDEPELANTILIKGEGRNDLEGGHKDEDGDGEE